MAILSCYVNDRTHEILARYSRENGRTIEELAESAIAEAALKSDLADQETARRTKEPA